MDKIDNNMDTFRSIAGILFLIGGSILTLIGLFFLPALIYGIPVLIFGILLLVDFGNEGKIEKIKKRRK